MTEYGSKARAGVVLALALITAACASGPRPQVSQAAAEATDRGEIEAIVSLLDQGERAKAKKRIAAALKRDPGNATFMMLRDSIDRSPEELLGGKHFSYTTQAGDTMSGIAQRFLGNPLKFYQLSRYNGIERPAALQPGTVLRIPGEPRTESAQRPERRSEPQAATPRPKAARPPAAARPSPARPAHNAAAARQARSAGLAALNQGNPARAVELLSRAAALEPTNAAISRDLQRAQRINATVKARQ